MKEIKLSSVIKLKDPSQYKGHFAKFNQYDEPLDDFVNDPGDWEHWNTYKDKKKDHFNRSFIYSVMKFYHEEDTWLFGGIFKVLSRNGPRYKIELQDEASEYIGRLKFRFKLPGRTVRINLEKYYPEITVTRFP